MKLLDRSQAAAALAGAFCVLGLTALAAPGDLDTTFAGTGKARFGFGHGADVARAMAVQSDGKIVMAGSNERDFEVARFNPDGTLDASFGAGGIVITNFGTATSAATALRIQPDGKIVVAGYTINPFASQAGTQFAVARYNIDGSLDATFDGDGRVTTFVTFASIDKAYALALQGDKIVVAGESFNPNPGNYDFALVRYNADGSLDSSFGGDGKVMTPIGTHLPSGPADDTARGVTILGDTIIAAGSTRTGTNLSFAVVRYTSTGALDGSFDSDGIVTTAITTSSFATAVAIQSAEGFQPAKIVVAGIASNDLALVRYNLNGSPDTSFDGDGVVTTPVSDVDSNSAALTVQNGGKGVKITVSVAGKMGSRDVFGVARYSSGGALDTSFDIDGKMTLQISGSGAVPAAIAVQSDSKLGDKIFVAGTRYPDGADSDFIVFQFNADGSNILSFGSNISDAPATAKGVAVQGDGKIVVAGTSSGQAALIRCHPDGSLDSTFDGDGKVTAAIANEGAINAVARQDDGRIVLAGISFGSPSQVAVLRFNPDGSLDTTFDGDGRAFAAIGAFDFANAVAIQPDGKIVAVGVSNGASSDFALFRFNPNGSLDTTFNSSGKVVTPIPGEDVASAVTLQADGKIVVAGTSSNEFALARYNPDGSLDTSFDLDGILTTRIGTSGDQGYAVTIQPDGKILIAGRSSSFSGGHFAIARFHSNGAVDTSFNGVGKAVTEVAFDDTVHAIMLDAAGNITVAGRANLSDPNSGNPFAFAGDDFAAVRYKPDGSLDTSYASGGKFITDVSDLGKDIAFALAFDSAGRAILAGESDALFGVVRLAGDPIPTPTPTPIPTPTPTQASTLANISTRLRVETGDNVLIGGFIVTGTQPKKIIVRGIGTSLPFLDKLENPTLELHGPAGLIEANDNWVDSPNKQSIIDSTIPPSSDLESAIVQTLPANNAGYTAIVRGANNGTGIGLVEAYDLDRSVDSQLANIATRGLVQVDDNVLIAGTIVLGPTTRKVLVRAIGPSLPILGAMADPILELRDANGGLVRANDNWRSDQEAEIIATTIPPPNDFESALVETLSGNGASYTAILRGVNDTTGIAVVEIYALN